MCEHKSLINDAFVQLSYAYERKALSLHFGDFLSWQYLSLHARLSDLSPRVLKCFQYYIFKLRCVKIWITNCLIAVYTCVSLVSDHDESMTSAQLVSITVTSVFGCSRWHHFWSHVCTVAMSTILSTHDCVFKMFTPISTCSFQIHHHLVFAQTNSLRANIS